MDDAGRGQVSRSAAEVYEEFFVPALFGPFAAPMADAAGLAPGQHVLDVACGTGVFAREAARHVMPGGSVVGLDRNDGMLAVAARIAPSIQWQNGLAEDLPFGDATFDAAACQYGLMFFEDRDRAVAEMRRVVRPDGRVTLAVWDKVEHSPGYAAMIGLLDRLFGAEVADALRAPFALGEPASVEAILDRAGIRHATLKTVPGTASFPSLAAWLHTDVRGWTLADMIDDDQYATLSREAGKELAPFVQSDGSVRFAAPAHIVTGLA